MRKYKITQSLHMQPHLVCTHSQWRIHGVGCGGKGFRTPFVANVTSYFSNINIRIQNVYFIYCI